MAAATPIHTFLLPPVDSRSSTPPPKLNDGADPAYGAGSLCAASAGFSNKSAADARGFSSILGCGGSRAGAGALAAPAATGALATGGLNSLVGADTRGGEAGVATAALYKTGRAAGPAGAAGFSATGAAGGLAAAGAVGHAGVDAGFAAGAGDGFGAAVAAGATGFGGRDAGRAPGTAGLGAGLGVAAAGVATGADGVGTGAVGAGAAAAGIAKLPVAVALPAFPGSLLRSSPRATRKVPFACSMLMGLVRTRFAPIRNALATPACPSTTATASEV